MTTIQFDLNVPQASFLQLPHKFKAYVAGFGSGKTFVGCAGMVGKNSDQYRAVIRETSVVAIKRSQQKKQQIDAKTDAGAGELFDLGEDRNFKIACAVIVGAPGFTDKGEQVVVTKEFLRAAFTKFPTWQDRILAELEADANFLAI